MPVICSVCYVGYCAEGSQCCDQFRQASYEQQPVQGMAKVMDSNHLSTRTRSSQTKTLPQILWDCIFLWCIMCSHHHQQVCKQKRNHEVKFGCICNEDGSEPTVCVQDMLCCMLMELMSVPAGDAG